MCMNSTEGPEKAAAPLSRCCRSFCQHRHHHQYLKSQQRAPEKSLLPSARALITLIQLKTCFSCTPEHRDALSATEKPGWAAVSAGVDLTGPSKERSSEFNKWKRGWTVGTFFKVVGAPSCSVRP